MSRSNAAACPVCERHAESVFKIEGMDCHEEVAILERRLRHLAGFEDLSADVIGQRLSVNYDAAKLSASLIADAVAETGMRAWLEHEDSVVLASRSHRRRRALVTVAGVGLVVGLTLQVLGASAVLSGAAFALAIVTSGLHVVRRAITSLRGRSIDINVLMMAAVAGALVLGELTEAAAVVFLFGLAQLLESWSMERARGAIRALMELSPTVALVRRGAEDVRVGVDDVRMGEVMIVRPGEKIPLDGRVAAGEGDVNQAPVTGESLPVDKRAGDEVFAGTINGRGALEVVATRLRGDTTFARIIHLVERAQAQRAPAQLLVERFARVYTPVVLGLAFVLAVGVPLALAEPVGPWVYRALVLLVISCPCALVISTPVSFVSALAGAARKGVLIKGGIHLERTGSVRCIAFDKTGTLTKGQIRVRDVVAVDEASADQVLSMAAALEVRSEHPIGQAIVTCAAARGLQVPRGVAFRSLPGRGAEASVDGAQVVVGNHRLFQERGWCDASLDERVKAMAESGQSTVIVAVDGRAVGIIGVADELREAGGAVMELLRAQGVEHLILLTGDNAATAAAIASQLGLDDYRAELLPEDKVAAIEELRRSYGTVMMVGDGINDAPALAAADVGVAMGVVGSDAALETADVALIADELLKIPFAIRLSRSALWNIRVNIAISLGLKAAFLALAVTGLATLWMAVMADTGASLIVIANGLRLLRVE